jgi:hypothetical protein
MSRAFVNEDAVAPEALPDRPISPHPNDVTRQGMAHLEEMLDLAREAHAAAVATQDRAAMAYATRELRYWRTRRASARWFPIPPIEHKSGSAAQLGFDGRMEGSRRFGSSGRTKPIRHEERFHMRRRWLGRSSAKAWVTLQTLGRAKWRSKPFNRPARGPPMQRRFPQPGQ